MNRHGKPLKPTRNCALVRILLHEHKAVVVNNNPFTICLKYELKEKEVVKDLVLGIDVGRQNIGLGVSDKDGNCLYLCNIITNNKNIKLKMTERKMYRNIRRLNRRMKKQRRAKANNTFMTKGNDDIIRNKIACKSKNIKYPGMDLYITCKGIKGKEAKFNNRVREQGWLSPSARQCIQMHLLAIEKVLKILPIGKIVIEYNKFDFQKMKKSDIKPWEYQNGTLHGYDGIRDFLYEEQNHRCLLCENIIDKSTMEVHHIKQRKNGGINNVLNEVCLCKSCHSNLHKNKDLVKELESKKQGLLKKYSVGLLNSIIPQLTDEIQSYCNKNNLEFNVCMGIDTKAKREVLGLEKDHCIDAYCISLYDNDSVPSFIVDKKLIMKRYKKKSKNKIHKLGSRQYLYQGKVVAINRHKAMEQKEDSLEEYLNKYRKTHTEKETRKHFKELEVRPAQRQYTYHKEKINPKIHVGDKVLYEKHFKTKPSIKEIFIVKKLNVSQNQVLYETKGKNLKYCRPIESGCLQFI